MRESGHEVTKQCQKARVTGRPDAMLSVGTGINQDAVCPQPMTVQETAHEGCKLLAGSANAHTDRSQRPPRAVMATSREPPGTGELNTSKLAALLCRTGVLDVRRFPGGSRLTRGLARPKAGRCEPKCLPGNLQSKCPQIVGKNFPSLQLAVYPYGQTSLWLPSLPLLMLSRWPVKRGIRLAPHHLESTAYHFNPKPIGRFL